VLYFKEYSASNGPFLFRRFRRLCVFPILNNALDFFSEWLNLRSMNAKWQFLLAETSTSGRSPWGSLCLCRSRREFRTKKRQSQKDKKKSKVVTEEDLILWLLSIVIVIYRPLIAYSSYLRLIKNILLSD